METKREQGLKELIELQTPMGAAGGAQRFEQWWDKFNWTAANDLPGTGSVNRRIAESAWNAALAAAPQEQAGTLGTLKRELWQMFEDRHVQYAKIVELLERAGQAAPATLSEEQVRKAALLEAASTICVRCAEGLAIEFHGTPAAPSHVVGGERAHCYAWAIHALIMRNALLRSQPLTGAKDCCLACGGTGRSKPADTKGGGA